MKKATGKPGKDENIFSRFDRLNHFVICQEKQTKCKLCHKKTLTRCQKCDIGLHVKCFVDYHTK